MAAASYHPQILCPKNRPTGNVKPLTANRSLPFAVKWPNLDLKVSKEWGWGYDIKNYAHRPRWITASEFKIDSYLIKIQHSKKLDLKSSSQNHLKIDHGLKASFKPLAFCIFCKTERGIVRSAVLFLLYFCFFVALFLIPISVFNSPPLRLRSVLNVGSTASSFLPFLFIEQKTH